MADYTKTVVSAVYSENSDYSDPYIERSFTVVDATPTLCEVRRVIADIDSNEYFDTGIYTSISRLIVKNLDATNYVDVIFNNAANDTVTLRVQPGDVLVVPDVRVEPGFPVYLQANTADCLCEVIIIGVC